MATFFQKVNKWNSWLTKASINGSMMYWQYLLYLWLFILDLLEICFLVINCFYRWVGSVWDCVVQNERTFIYICIYCRCVGTIGYINVTIGGGKVPNTNTNPENELPQIRKYHYYICQDESRLSQCYYIPGRKTLNKHISVWFDVLKIH